MDGSVDNPSESPTVFELVGEFHRVFGLPCRTIPSASLPDAEAALRQAMLDEEVGELRRAVANGDVLQVADALADIVYVVCGTAHCYGIDLDAVIREVHRSNMTKLDPDGQPIYRSDGKVQKGPGFEPPDIARALRIGARSDSPSSRTRTREP